MARPRPVAESGWPFRRTSVGCSSSLEASWHRSTSLVGRTPPWFCTVIPSSIFPFLCCHPSLDLNIAFLAVFCPTTILNKQTEPSYPLQNDALLQHRVCTLVLRDGHVHGPHRESPAFDPPVSTDGMLTPYTSIPVCTTRFRFPLPGGVSSSISWLPTRSSPRSSTVSRSPSCKSNSRLSHGYARRLLTAASSVRSIIVCLQFRCGPLC